MRTDRMIDVPFRTQQFVILAVQLGSFHKAAHALGVDHSRVVRSIHRLEGDLDVKIFDRTRHHLSVTRAGVPFVREIAKAVAHIERACDLARYCAQIDQGPFRVGYSAYVHSRLIPILQGLELPANSGLLAAPDHLDNHAPGQPFANSQVALECGTTVELVERVIRGDLHAGLAVAPLLDSHLSTYHVAREPFSLAVSRNHRLAKQLSVLVRDLDREAVFFFPRASHPLLFDRIIEYIESTGASPVLRETASLTHTMEIVAHNFGVALVPHSDSRFSHTGVLFKPVADKLLFMETALFHSTEGQDNRTQWVIRELLTQVRRASLDH